jgi:hypothetical protein
MKKILLSALVLGTMSSFALAGEPAKLDATQLSAVAAGEDGGYDCGCYTPSFSLAAASKKIFVGVSDEAVAINQGGQGIGGAAAEATAAVSVLNHVGAIAGGVSF